MTTPSLGPLTSVPALDRPDLLAVPVLEGLRAWPDAAQVGVVEIPPQFADTAAMMAEYSLPFTVGANCVIIAGKREGQERVAACVVRSDHRVDVNGVARRSLDVRRPSFMPRDRATAETGMEFGGITPFGLPVGWRVFADPVVLDVEVAVFGSGLRKSKLLVSGSLLGKLPGLETVEGLGGGAPA